jgi:hypothetical protein
MTDITKLEHARVFKKAGLPLDMQVEERMFSKEYTKHWFALMKAHHKFRIALNEAVAGPRAGSRTHRLVGRRFVSLTKQMQICDAFVGKLLGGEQLSKRKDGTASEQDQHEGQLMAQFLTERAVPFARFWQDTFERHDDAVRNNTSVDMFIPFSDIPPWTDED